MQMIALLLLLGIGSVARAEEKVVPLREGMTVWGILEDEECSQEQIAVLWRIVFRDSELDPDEERDLEEGQLIVIKRDCAGQLLKGGNPVDEGLEGTLANLRDDLEKATKKADRFFHENAELAKSLARRVSPMWRVAALLLTVVTIALVLYASRLKYLLAKSFQFPMEIVFAQWGNRYVARFGERADTGHPGYECPECGEWFYWPPYMRRHFQEAHGDAGRFTWEASREEKGENSSS